MSILNILHISDLHFEEKSISQHKQLAAGLVTDLKVLKSEGIVPDILLFSGDMVNKGSDGIESYKKVSTIYVEPLLSQCGLTQEHFFCVPGNHDVDRNHSYKELEQGLALQLIDSDSLREYHAECTSNPHRYEPFRQKFKAFKEFERSYRGVSHLYEDDFLNIDSFELKGLKIGIARFNSAWRSSGFGTDQGRLLIGAQTIEKSLELLEKCDIRLAVTHHPLGWLAEWDERECQNRLAKNFNFLFCGHLHDSNSVLFQQILGGVYISSAGCLKSGRLSNYSVLSIDLANDEVTTRFRKWYPDRGEFDQETEKAKNGVVTFAGIFLKVENIQSRLKFAELRENLRVQLRFDKIVNPLEGIIDLNVDDVFVEPFIRDASVHNREEEKPATFDFEELVAERSNLLFVGGKESGKSTLLLRINELELRPKTNDIRVEIPIRIRFSKFSKHNTDGFERELRKAISDKVSVEELRKFLIDGLIVILVDDLGDRNDVDRNRKLEVFSEFLIKYPKVRIIATLMETVRPFYCERLELIKKLLNTREYYLWPFTTSRLRILLTKIASRKKTIGGTAVDLDRVLDQIVYYFRNLQMPITPLAATLFIGVLFRDIKQKDIQNEAFLIENYLKDILEKIGNSSAKAGDLEFPEKVAFLAHIASKMHERRQAEWTLEEFDTEKVIYFKNWGETPPPKSVIDEFFDKGILDLYVGKVSFKFKFWGNFFLAKAMARNRDIARYVMDRKDYLLFAVAISYKSGLLRNDVELLEEITARLIEAGKEFGSQDKTLEEILNLPDQISQFTEKLEEEIRQKNTESAIDSAKDSDLAIILSEGGQDEEDDESGNIIDLLTLHSEVIKHTREVSEIRKVEVIRINVQGYIGLTYLFNESLLQIVGRMSAEDLARFMFPKRSGKTAARRIDSMLKHGRQMLWRIVPTSVALYLADHLAASRMAGAFISASKAPDITPYEKTLHLLLAFRADFSRGLEQLEIELSKKSNPVSDFVAQAFIQIVTQESRMETHQLNSVIELLTIVNKKYQPKIETNDHMSGPNIQDQIRKRLKINSEEK
jgi:predicted MPP superfamily phosphohydrolase